jgi:hypothetical protein
MDSQSNQVKLHLQNLLSTDSNHHEVLHTLSQSEEPKSRLRDTLKTKASPKDSKETDHQ